MPPAFVYREHAKMKFSQKWRDFVNSVRLDDGAAAKEHLAAGRPIYYAKNPGQITREWPDGRVEIVRVSADGQIDTRERHSSSS